MQLDKIYLIKESLYDTNIKHIFFCKSLSLDVSLGNGNAYIHQNTRSKSIGATSHSIETDHPMSCVIHQDETSEFTVDVLMRHLNLF